MDAYFCYIYRVDHPIPEFRVISCNAAAELDQGLAELMNDYPGARLEIFEGDRPVTIIVAPGATV